jgi:hypothetical protein
MHGGTLSITQVYDGCHFFIPGEMLSVMQMTISGSIHPFL